MTTIAVAIKKIQLLNISFANCGSFVNKRFQKRNISTSFSFRALMDFFDSKKNWGATEVKSGRSWTKDDLRIKSNTDLHKLWYVLLKERNMLLTMEEECKDQVKLFPSPERLDKVNESMENLENVVIERNKAFYQLETGETGERPEEKLMGPFGLEFVHKKSEYAVPKHLNQEWHEKHNFEFNEKDVKVFLQKYEEQQYLESRRAKTRNFNHVIHLMNRFPNLDMEAVKKEFPDVDIEKAKASRKYRPMYYRE